MTAPRRFVQLAAPILLFCGSTVFSAEVMAHRGASKEAPENTLASTRLAYEQGADGVECDLYRTSDGKIAVIHDLSTKRTTGTEGNVEKMTLAEVQALDAGSWMDKKFAGEKIPSFDELLNAVPEGKKLMIELKGGEELIAPIKDALVRIPKKTEQIMFISFKYAALKALKKELPQYPSLLLAGYTVDKTTGKPKMELDEAIQKCKDGALDGLSLSASWPIDAAFVKKVHDAGLKLSVWTINDAEKARKLVAIGTDIVCTDKPGLISQALKK